MSDRIRTDWTAPAQLVVWPGEPEPGERPVTTLREAVAEASRIASGTPWIVLADGRILRPGQIAELRAALTRD